MTVSAPVRLVDIGPTDVAAKLAGDPTLTTGGNLSAIATSVLACDLRGKLPAEIAKAFEANALRAQLPDLPGLFARIEKVEFAQDGGHLSVQAVATATATGATLGAVVDRLLPSLQGGFASKFCIGDVTANMPWIYPPLQLYAYGCVLLACAWLSFRLSRQWQWAR